MLKIRLQRIGKKKQAYFRVVVMEHTRKPKGPYVEDLGSYDPHKNELSVNAERVKYWLGNGAQMSPTVNNLLVGKDVIEGEKVQAWKAKPRKPGTKPEDAESLNKELTSNEPQKPGTKSETAETQNQADNAESKMEPETAEIQKQPEGSKEKTEVEPTEPVVKEKKEGAMPEPAEVPAT